MNDLTAIFKVLSDENRLRMLMLLRLDPICVCELCGILELSQPKVSKNLSKLRDLNIVTDERKEKFVYYRINHDNAMLMSILEQIEKSNHQYPKLLEDKVRFNEKEKYLNQCTVLSSIN